MILDRIRFILAAPFFITGFFLIFTSVVIMAGFLTACAGVYKVNQLLGADDAPFVPPNRKQDHVRLSQTSEDTTSASRV
jgi:hypothetical protein